MFISATSLASSTSFPSVSLPSDLVVSPVGGKTMSEIVALITLDDSVDGDLFKAIVGRSHVVS